MASLIPLRLTIFWLTMAVLAVPLALVVWRYLALLGRGHAGGRPGVPAGAGGVLRAALRLPPGVRRPLARHLLLDGLLQRGLWRRGKGRWLAHAGIIFGFLGLMAMSAVAATAEHLLRPLGLAPGLVAVILNKDHPLMALPNETFGLMLIAGGLAGAARRLGRRGPLPVDAAPDVAAVALLMLMAAGGYVLEATRLLMEAVPPEAARYSYIGRPIAALLAPLSLRWDAWHFWLFQLHVLNGIALLVYWPLSKMTHVLAAPLVAALGAMEAGDSR